MSPWSQAQELALRRTNQNRTRAAELLGISRRTLQNKTIHRLMERLVISAAELEPYL